MPVFEITSFRGGLSDFEDKGTPGSFKYGSGLDIRKRVDSLSAGQALIDIGDKVTSLSLSPSASRSPSASLSASLSASVSPSSSASPSTAGSSSRSPSGSASPSASRSPSSSLSPSHSTSPSPSPSAGLTTVFSDLIQTFVKCSDGKIYGFGNTGKVYKINPEDNSTLQVYDLHKPIIGAAEKPSSNGKTYLLFATRNELHRKEIPGRSDWNDVNERGTVQGDEWPKTNLTSADWHTMENVGGDIMITNASTLAMAAYDDSYTNEALDLIPGNIAKTVVERNGRAVIGTVLAADPDRGVNGAVDTEVYLSQVGDDGDIYFADFSNSLSVKRIKGGGKVNPGGMTHQYEFGSFFDWEQNALSWIDKQVLKNMALLGIWSADTGYNGIYTYGRLDKNHPFTLNLEYPLEVDEIGAVTSVDGIVYASYRSSTAFGVKVVDLTSKGVGTYEGLDLRSPVKKAVDITNWKTAEVFMTPLPSGASVEFWYKVNKTGSFIRANTTDGHSSYSVTSGDKANFTIGAQAEVYEYKLILRSFGNLSPEVHRLRIYFD